MAMTLSKKQGKIAGYEHDKPDFEKLFQQHWVKLCKVLYRMVGDWDEAEDLALETFEQLYHHPPADTRNLGGWLYRVATNRGLNALRARQRRQHYEEQAGVIELVENTPLDPAKMVENIELREQVRAVLGLIKPRSAQMLVLRYSGLSYAEIASVLDVSPGSIGTLLARAEREFEELYGGEEMRRTMGVRRTEKRRR